MEQGVWGGRAHLEGACRLGPLLWGRAMGGRLGCFMLRISQTAKKELRLGNRGPAEGCGEPLWVLVPCPVPGLGSGAEPQACRT